MLVGALHKIIFALASLEGQINQRVCECVGVSHLGVAQCLRNSTSFKPGFRPVRIISVMLSSWNGLPVFSNTLRSAMERFSLSIVTAIFIFLRYVMNLFHYKSIYLFCRKTVEIHGLIDRRKKAHGV